MKSVILLQICLMVNTTLSFSQKKVLTFGDFEVFKTENTKTYQIRSSNGVMKLDALQFVAPAGQGLQVLDSRNALIYLNNALDTVAFPKFRQNLFCGTAMEYIRLEIIEEGNNYKIKKTVKKYAYPSSIETNTIDFFSKKDIKDICFLNQQRNMAYDANAYVSDLLIIETEGGFGIRANKQTTYYENIDYSDSLFIKVKENGLWGYLNRTSCKYKKLGNFVFNLAQFELKDGKKGYIDKGGIEYY